MNKSFPEFQYYYLGYYIQGCSKMVYKGDYEPAELVCPQTYQWVALDDRVRKLIAEDNDDSARIAGPNVAKLLEMDFSKQNTDWKKFIDNVNVSVQGQLISFNKLNNNF